MATGKEVGGAIGGTSVIDDGKDPALLVESTDGADYLKISTVDGAEGVTVTVPSPGSQDSNTGFTVNAGVGGNIFRAARQGASGSGNVIFMDSGTNNIKVLGAGMQLNTTNNITMNLGTSDDYFKITDDDDLQIFRVTQTGLISTGGEETSMGVGAGSLHVYTGSSSLGSASTGADDLVIEGSSHTGMTILSGSNNQLSSIFFACDDANGSGWVRYNHNATPASGSMAVKSNGFTFFETGGENERMRIDASGLVGIGATVPVHKLHVQDGDAAIVTNNADDDTAKSLIFKRSKSNTDGTAVVVADNDILGNIEFQGAEDGDSWATGAKIFARVNGTPGDGDMPTELVFATSKDGTETPLEYMRLTNTGTLQILNYEDENRFSFSSDADIGTLQMDAGSGSTRTVITSGTTGSYLRYSALNLGQNNTTSEGMLHVVVGTSDTAGAGGTGISVVNDRNCIKCEMDDTTNNPIVVDLANTGSGDAIKYAGPSSTFFHVKSDGDCENTNNSYGGISDRRLKENITDATLKLSDINKLQVRNFNFIGDDLKQIGLVADEVAEVFPGLVKSSDARTYSRTESVGDDGELQVEKELIGGLEDQKSVKYSVLVPMLIKAVQELSARIEELENDGD